MSDQDNASPIVRYNLILNEFEYFNGADWYPGTVAIPTNTPTLGLPIVGALAGTGTVTPVATSAGMYTIIVSGNVTLNGPSSPTDGQKVIFRILNDATHSVTLATGAGNFRFSTDIPSYTNSVSLTDYIGAIYNGPANRWDVVAINQGF